MAEACPRGEGGGRGDPGPPMCLPDRVLTKSTLHTPRLTLGRGVPVVFRDHRETGGSMSTGEGRGGKTYQTKPFLAYLKLSLTWGGEHGHVRLRPGVRTPASESPQAHLRFQIFPARVTTNAVVIPVPHFPVERTRIS